MSDRRSIDLAQALLVTDESLPGRRVLDALVYLLDRRLGGDAPYSSNFHGPRYPEIDEEIGRWQVLGQAVLTITMDDQPTDTIDGQTIVITRRTGHRGHELAVRADLADAAREIWSIGHRVGLTSTRAAIAAKLVQCREFGLTESFEDLVVQFRWAHVPPADYTAGIAFARALGYK